ncbi:hypothetical protein SAMN05421788_112194 [Filimonas lacunae]|uniref:Uncharacterized protein n=2 Tax=Filimonas lacunae TaxID=477680 RepID=A0A1N7REK1_9BACT|nr:hypothetical protein SAMN05421788_112194 [Filimonas lacunae]
MYNMEYFFDETQCPSLMRLHCLAEKITGPEKMCLGLQTLVEFKEVRQNIVKELGGYIAAQQIAQPAAIVNQYLKSITRSSDKLHHYSMLIKKHVPQKITFLGNITDNLSHTITTIISKWPSCNYLQLKVPAAFSYKKMRNLTPRWLWVQQRMSQMITQDELYAVMRTLVRKCKPEKHTRISWQRFLYTEDLLKNLEDLLRKHQSSITFEDAFIELLVSMDYNEKDFLSFYTCHIEESIKSAASFYDKKNVLNAYFDKLEKLPASVIPFTPLHPSPHTKEHLPLKGRLLQELTTHTSVIHQKQLLIEHEMRQLIWKNN